MSLRPTRAGLVGGGVYVLLALAWFFVTAAPPFSLAWFGAVVCAGLFLPGAANQVTLARAYLAAPALVYSRAGAVRTFLTVLAPAPLISSAPLRRPKST